MNRKQHSWRDREDGATSIEYALMASLITGVIALTVSVLGGKTLNMFTAIAALFP